MDFIKNIFFKTYSILEQKARYVEPDMKACNN